MPQSRVFEMINAMLRRDARAVFEQLDALKTLKESAFMVLALLLTNFERILHTKILLARSEPHGNIAAKIKVPPYFVRDYVGAAQRSDKAFYAGRLRILQRLTMRSSRAELRTGSLWRIFWRNAWCRKKYLTAAARRDILL